MSKEDKILRMLNDMKIDRTEYEETNLSTEEKEQLFQTFQAEMKPAQSQKPNNRWIALAAAILLLIAGSQTSIGQQVQAAATSIIENIRYSLSNALGNEETKTPGALSFNQTAQIGSVEVSIKDLIAFEHRIVFNLLVDMEGDVQEEHFIGFDEMSIQVNGKKLNTDFWTATGTIYDEEENIHSNIYSIQLDESISEEELIEIDIHFDGIRYYQPRIANEEQLLIEGDATFSSETTREELNKYTDVYDIQTSVIQNNFEYIIENMYINPVLNFIEVYSDDKDVLDMDFQLMEFRGEDENGREVLFTQTNMFVSDDHRKYAFSLNEEASEITSKELTDIKTLDLQFYVTDWPEGETDVEFDPAGEPFTVDLTK